MAKYCPRNFSLNWSSLLMTSAWTCRSSVYRFTCLDLVFPFGSTVTMVLYFPSTAGLSPVALIKPAQIWKQSTLQPWWSPQTSSPGRDLIGAETPNRCQLSSRLSAAGHPWKSLNSALTSLCEGYSEASTCAHVDAITVLWVRCALRITLST